jgi:hypothetical protein
MPGWGHLLPRALWHPPHQTEGARFQRRPRRTPQFHMLQQAHLASKSGGGVHAEIDAGACPTDEMLSSGSRACEDEATLPSEHKSLYTKCTCS